MTTGRRLTAALVAAGVLAMLAAGTPTAQADADTTSIAAAECGSGSSPETGLQGQVPRRDRVSGRSARGYSCNLDLVGRYQGRGAGVINPSYRDCGYFGTVFPFSDQGVQVIDAGDPSRPRLSAQLRSTAFLSGTWESLKVDPTRGLLAATAVQVPPGVGGLAFDVYDVGRDCAHPRLLNRLAGPLTIPSPVTGHEGGFAPDGRTYYATSGLGQVTAIDLADPARPRVVFTGAVGATNHGFSISPDGDTMYGTTLAPGGVQVLDVSDIQRRRPTPAIRQLGQVSWTDGFFTQHTVNFTRDGRRYLFAVDEGGVGSVRLIDVEDPARPRVLREYRLRIQQPAARSERAKDRDTNGPFGYDAHYCVIDKPTDPERMVCSYYESGVRLYDIRDLLHPRELGYYNPPAQTGLADRLRLRSSGHSYVASAPPVIDANDLLARPLPLPSVSTGATTDYCSSPAGFGSDGQISVTCMDNGFMALRYRPR